MRLGLTVLVAAAAATDRKQCAAPGRYEPRNGTDLLARAFDGPSFFGEGRWMNNDKYVLAPPCELKEGDAFACSVLAKIPRNGSRARLLMAGDSISIRQFQDFKRRVARCDVFLFAWDTLDQRTPTWHADFQGGSTNASAAP